jgi:hypothetical protein
MTILIKRLACVAGTAMLAIGVIATTDAAFAGKKDGMKTVHVEKVKHRHHRWYDRSFASGYSDDGGYYVYSEPKTIYSAGQYVGRDPDPRIRGQMLIDFNRGVTATGGR